MAKEKLPTEKAADAKKAKAKRAKEAEPKSEKGDKSPKPGMARYAIAIIIIVAIIGAAIFAGAFAGQQGQGSFTAFKDNFNSAPRVAIFVTAYNGTVLSGTVGCATAVIEDIVGSRANHRNASTIDFNVINQTACIRSVGLTGKTSNYTSTSLQNCLNLTKTEPTIYINYSSVNTTIIKPDYLYIAGTTIFLRECGIASQIS